MIDERTVVVVLAYGSLLVELLRFPIPSEASVYQLMVEPEDASGGGARLDRARSRTMVRKFVCYFLPTAVGVGLFLIPLVAAFWRPLIDYCWPLPGLVAPWTVWLGIAMVVAGRALTFGSVLQLRRRKASRELQPRGLFSWSRNPGLVGMYAFYLGLALLFPCVILFMGLVPYVLNMHGRVLMEESHLSDRLGASYADYLARVPRYLFF